MTQEEFIRRLTKLRFEKGVSARDMSLSLGQNPSYINNIECGKALPSMTVFFYICEYLQITPKDFFDLESSNPQALSGITEDLKKLSSEDLYSVSAIVRSLAKKKSK